MKHLLAHLADRVAIWRDRREARRMWRLSAELRRECRHWLGAADVAALEEAARLLAMGAVELEWHAGH